MSYVTAQVRSVRLFVRKEAQTISQLEEEKLEEWIRQYSGLILTICYSMTKDYFDAEDLTQETFLSAYRGYDRFDGTNEKAWLSAIATNKCRDYLKSAARRIRPAEEEAFRSLSGRDHLPEESALAEDASQKLVKLCRELKEPYQEVAVSYFLQGQTAPEIAKRTGRNVNTVHTQLHRIRGMLQKGWKEMFG